MHCKRFHLGLMICCTLLLAGFSQTAAAATLCVNPGGSHGCYASIQAAVNHASANDVIKVGAGVYAEGVTIGIPLSVIGAGAEDTVIDEVLPEIKRRRAE